MHLLRGKAMTLEQAKLKLGIKLRTSSFQVHKPFIFVFALYAVLLGGAQSILQTKTAAPLVSHLPSPVGSSTWNDFSQGWGPQTMLKETESPN